MYPTVKRYSTSVASHTCTANLISTLINKNKNMTGGKKIKYPRGHAKIKGIFGRMKLEASFLKKIKIREYFYAFH